MNNTNTDNTSIIPFNFHNTAVRTVVVNHEPWFVGRDICQALGYTNPSKAINDHCKGITKCYPLSTPGGTQEVRILSEADVIRLICCSHLPSAVEFEKWVFEEVLPSIRKHGGYLTPQKMEEALLNPDVLIRLATDLKEEREKRIQAER